MRSRFPHFRSMAAAGCALMFLVPAGAAAHDVKEMTAWARVFPDRVEVVVTISTHMAAVLLARPNEPPVELSSETVEAFRKRLEEQAKTFCTLHSGAKDALVLRSLDVVMRAPGELSFYLTYQAPGSGPLRFEMEVLNRLEPGNQVALVVLDAVRKPIAGKIMDQNAASLEIPRAAPPPAAPPPTPGKPQPGSGGQRVRSLKVSAHGEMETR